MDSADEEAMPTTAVVNAAAPATAAVPTAAAPLPTLPKVSPTEEAFLSVLLRDSLAASVSTNTEPTSLNRSILSPYFFPDAPGLCNNLVCRSQIHVLPGYVITVFLLRNIIDYAHLHQRKKHEPLFPYLHRLGLLVGHLYDADGLFERKALNIFEAPPVS